jgi:hypothetical protein
MVLQKIKKYTRRNATLIIPYRFRTLLQLIPRKKFDNLVTKWDVDKGTKNFKCFEMTCSLIVSSILGLESYRDIEETIKVPKSTLGDSLSKRPSGFFEELCCEILKAIKAEVSDRKVKKAIREIIALDSSEIVVHGSAFALPGWQQKSVGTQHKASGKIHTVWNINNEWIEDFRITPGRRGDSPVSLEFTILPNKMYVFDRAYNDLGFWHKITEFNSYFVTRLKDSARIKMIELKLGLRRTNKSGVLYDGVYRPTNGTLIKHKNIPKNIKFRHIIYRDYVTKKLFHFVTSDFQISAKDVAAIYKKRWAVELLFRWMKGHLKIRRLATEKPNAIKIQLAIAVLTLLLLQFQKIINAIPGTLWSFLRHIRSTVSRNGLISQGFQGYLRGFSAIEVISTA